ncbi:sulfatase-like hydrolase/transferase [Pontiella agarivorans]|uniref:Sulfatase-like hydrolase/transferase n=1 Tax=Pontiella agarivorans TaxID=3038953 RepID=A0ABU5MUC6_9BACT|nr:sulfatase-like hydrolase/transferase [Pontiella agarivorans]MDZ8117829.1 sulfatase-like hydrolase/transferase [Pontiella agarivorans]
MKIMLSFLGLVSASCLAGTKPNVVIIMADDLGAESIGCYGTTGFLTPNIDRLAEQGAILNNAYGTPSCSPSRSMILTGLYTNRSGILERLGKGTPNRLPAHIPTFGDLFKDHGYKTAISGKWHLGGFDLYPNQPVEHGFDDYFLFSDYYEGVEYERYRDPVIYADGRSKTYEGLYGPDLFCDRICTFMEENKEHPFLAYYPMVLTHKPFHKPPRLGGEIKHNLPDDCGNDNDSFGLMVSYADLMVGRILDKLDELGIADHTIVIFTADNGTPAAITSHMGDLEVQGGKLHLKESGWRIPYIIRWPGRVPPGLRESFFTHADLFPTLAGLTGLSMTYTVDGMDLSHNLFGTPGKDRDFVYLGWEGGLYMVRDQRFEIHENGTFYRVPVSSSAARYSEHKVDPAAFPEAYERLNGAMREYMKVTQIDDSYTIIPFKGHKKFRVNTASKAGKISTKRGASENHPKQAP